MAGGEGFYAANEAASERGGREIAEMRARAAEARAAAAAAYASSHPSPPSANAGDGSRSATGNQSNSVRSFTNNGYNDMTVTYDQLRNTAPARGTNTIRVKLGGETYAITYDFYPGSYMCHGGDLTGATVNVKFSGGRPISVKNYHGGEGYVDVKSYQRL